MHGFVTYGLLGTRLKQNIENKLRGVEKALKNGRLFPKGREILSFIDIDENVREVKLYLEKDLPPPNKYLKWLSDEVRKHPIRYIRKEAETKRILEGHTQIDAIIETDNLLILIEVKFTSDISPYTKFSLSTRLSIGPTNPKFSLNSEM